ncbi:MAG: hypothetical protein J7623_26020 [Chitinophaga sp.]|uniref:hypothetical protein n=1 Tax=Chitinophaga sp. TaxID=1869181 RepID=UPI001B1A6654|nr:hypothetical protein [Chitinophaga sp.]MBO9732125.1 hypothetical protein [Chitinophaga sp.]
MNNLKDEVAVVFAASGEVAGTVARAFAQHGAKVYVTARNLDPAPTNPDKTAAFLVAENGSPFNSHIIGFDGGKINLL